MLCFVVILLAGTRTDILLVIHREISSSPEAECRTTISFSTYSLGLCARLSYRALHLPLASIVACLCSSIMKKFFSNEGISFITTSQSKCLAPCRGIRPMTVCSNLITFSLSVLISSAESSIYLAVILTLSS